jgi:hypothetical protein
MSESVLLSIGIIVLVAVLLLLTWRQLRHDMPFALRPLKAYEEVSKQVGLAVESGRRLHLTLGRAALHDTAGPTSVAALQVLRYLADASSQSGVPPWVTVGDGTLLPAAQDDVRRAYEAAGRASEFRLTDVVFVADQDHPIAYAAGVTSAIEDSDTGNNVAVGRFGSEVAIIAEAGRRSALSQVLGSDDPTAVALATAYTDNVLWGEELFAAGAYLDGTAVQMAGVRTQDIVRWFAVAAILLIAGLRLLGLL